MNTLELMTYRNHVASYVKSFHIKRNVINLNVHSSWEHELIKCRICYLLKSKGQHFFTEVPLRSGKHNAQADILILDTAQIIEILVSETLQQVKKKIEHYPTFLEILAVEDSEAFFEGKEKLIREKVI